jgi:ribulose-5-phosphate 4-epimerase/fuculose-1-phosphate aldolase
MARQILASDEAGRARYGAAEWQVRCDLAALYRLAARYGMSDIIYTHISARVPGIEHEFLINPFGMLFEHMTASALVRIDRTGAIVDRHAPAGTRVNPAGFNIHSAVHMARHEVACVIHSHTVAGMAVAAQEGGLLPLTQHAMMFYDAIAFHDYESFASQEEERARIAADLGDRDVMILRNHGMLIAGRSIGEAFHTAYHLERACEAQLKAQASGVALHIPPLDIARKTAGRMQRIPPAHYDFFWQACLDLLEPPPADFRT